MTAVMDERPATNDVAERRAAAVETRKAAHARGLARLMSARPDLAGTYAPADLTLESLSWSV